MDWDKLRIFHAVASAGSFTHAGEALNLSQSAVSRQISTLEDSLGVPLFHRHARGLILTEQGEILYETAHDITKQLNVIEGQIGDTRQLAQGPLVLTIAEFLGSTWLVPKLQEFRENFPEIQLTVLFDDRVLNLGMREADCGIRLTKPEQQDLIQKQLTSIRFHACASKDYIETYGEPSSLTTLKDHKLIGYPSYSVIPFEQPNWLLDAAEVKVDSPNVMQMNSMYAIFKAVQSGAGIAMLPDYLINSQSDLQIILPQVTRPEVNLYFVYPEERRNSKRIATIRDFLIKNIHEDQLI